MALHLRYAIVDVRDAVAPREVLVDAAAALGEELDIVSINAGISGASAAVEDISDEAWNDVLGINLTGAFNTARAAVPWSRTCASRPAEDRSHLTHSRELLDSRGCRRTLGRTSRRSMVSSV